MSVTPKRFSNDELEWKAKKIKNVRIEHAKINQINLARKKSKPLASFKQIAQSNPAKAKLLKCEKLSNNGYEVVFKITSSAKNTKQLSAHINYISRQGSLELIDSDLNIYTNKKTLCIALKIIKMAMLSQMKMKIKQSGEKLTIWFFQCVIMMTAMRVRLEMLHLKQ